MAVLHIKDGVLTDRPTDRPTDLLTNIVMYRAGEVQLKTHHKVFVIVKSFWRGDRTTIKRGAPSS